MCKDKDDNIIGKNKVVIEIWRQHFNLELGNREAEVE
jgi:hypothetical protein